MIEMVGLLVLSLLLPSAMGIVVAEPLPLALDCVRAVLTARGESIFRVDQEQGVVTTSFRLVNPEALRRIAVTDREAGRIRWTRGIYQLTIIFSPVDGDGTRVRVSARVFGAGESSLPLMRPSNMWPLLSTGSLESDVLAALTAHCRANP